MRRSWVFGGGWEADELGLICRDESGYCMLQYPLLMTFGSL